MRIYDHTGETIGTWKVISIISNRPVKKYLLKCQCGNEREVTSSHIYRKSECKFCIGKKSVEEHLGEINGAIQCIGHFYKNKRHGLVVKCKCGHIYNIESYYQFKRTQSCKSCRAGYFPGKKIENSTLIRRINNRVWEKQCVCGKIFQADSRKTHCGCKITEKMLKNAGRKIGLKLNNLKVIGIEGFIKGRLFLKVKCECGKILSIINGHEFKSKSCGCFLGTLTGEKSSKATLTNSEVLSIRELFSTGLYTEEELSNMINKDKYYVRRILKKEIWKHI